MRPAGTTSVCFLLEIGQPKKKKEKIIASFGLRFRRAPDEWNFGAVQLQSRKMRPVENVPPICCDNAPTYNNVGSNIYCLLVPSVSRWNQMLAKPTLTKKAYKIK